MIKQLYLGYVNAYLLEENGNFMLVDTGGYLFADKGKLNNRRDVLIEQLNEAGVNRNNLRLLVLTHGDADHCMNASYIANQYDVPIAMHEADVKMVNAPTLELLMKTVNYRKMGMRIVSKLIHGLLVKLTEKTIEDFELFEPDILLKDGERLEKYGFSATVVHLPGHTPGSIAIMTDDKEAMVGDAGPETINAFDFKEFDQSLEKLKRLDCKKLYTGHMNGE